jgi:hypothetical protein
VPRLNSLRFTPLRHMPLFPQTSPPLLACFNGDSTTKDQHREPPSGIHSLYRIKKIVKKRPDLWVHNIGLCF